MEYIANISYGKDSLAMLEIIKQHDMPLDRIVHAEIWATDTIPADLPPMVEFKVHADKIIKERYGIEVEHVRAPITYEQGFYLKRGRTGRKSKFSGSIYGFPLRCGQWCLQQLKLPVFSKVGKNAVCYSGIAADEPERFGTLSDSVRAPLVEYGVSELQAREVCESLDLLSPIYTTCTRGGCWFCHCQPVEQLRSLRRNYPDLWALLLKWDTDSPVTFRADGHTVHDFYFRFSLEERGLLPAVAFRWNSFDPNQLTFF